MIERLGHTLDTYGRALAFAMDTAELRSRFRQFVGVERYRRFVRTLNRSSRSKGRLLYWQEQLWWTFSANVTPSTECTDDILAIFRVCDVHDCQLHAQTTDHPPTEIRETPESDEASDEKFPFAIGNLTCVDCRDARQRWIADNIELCRILRCNTTYADYCERCLADVADRESTVSRMKQRAVEIANQMEHGDELWEWDAGGWHRLSGSSGIAIVRNGEIVKQWCERRS